MSNFRDDAPPWSFFIPIALAVIVGVLAADAIRYAVVTVFGSGGTAQPVGQTPPSADAPAPVADRAVPAPVASGGEELSLGDETVDDQVAPPLPAMPAAQEQEQAVSRGADGVALPGPLNARRDGEQAACVNGTVVNRIDRGWEQALENDAPVRCTATSP